MKTELLSKQPRPLLGAGKFIVVGAVQRNGNVVARVIERTDAATLNRFVHETVLHKVSLLSTDDHKGYRSLDPTIPHGMVHHGEGNMVVGAFIPTPSKASGRS